MQLCIITDGEAQGDYRYIQKVTTLDLPECNSWFRLPYGQRLRHAFESWGSSDFPTERRSRLALTYIIYMCVTQHKYNQHKCHSFCMCVRKNQKQQKKARQMNKTYRTANSKEMIRGCSSNTALYHYTHHCLQFCTGLSANT